MNERLLPRWYLALFAIAPPVFGIVLLVGSLPAASRLSRSEDFVSAVIGLFLLSSFVILGENVPGEGERVWVPP